ncbi:MAG: ABC transporter permease [Bacteroidetes bacterium]|nr:ABC transporter permease [Bacteroidota bacterium]
MSFKIKVWHFIVFLMLLLIMLRINLLMNTFLLIIQFINLFVYSPSAADAQLEFTFFDSIISAILVIIIPVLTFLFRQRINFLQRKISFTSFVIIFLLSFFLFAPLIANTNPAFQKDLAVTKLLPPFSSIKVIHLKSDQNKIENSLSDFINLKNLVVKRSFDESLIFADSISIGNDLTYFQKGFPTSLSKDKLILKNNQPFITSKYFILGTDEFGRDIFSRLIYGARISLFVGLGSVLITLFLGLSLGFLAGYPGGFVDTTINRITDMFLAFPVIFFIILIIALFGNSLMSVIIVLGFSGWMSLFKIVRGEVISLKNKDFFISARLLGLSKTKLLLKEILPIIIAPVIVNLVFQYGNVILAEAALSYLGLGTGGSYPSWGSMIEAGQNYLSQAWWMILFPGAALFLTLFAANNLGREINSTLNPRLET